MNYMENIISSLSGMKDIGKMSTEKTGTTFNVGRGMKRGGERHKT